MADNNRNWNNQYQQSDDWEQNRNRFDEDRNREDYRYGNASYGNEYNHSTGDRSNYRSRQQYGENITGREMGNQGGYGAYSSDYGYQSSNNDLANRGSQNWRNTGNQSQQWRDEDWHRRNEGYGQRQQDWRRGNIDYENNYRRGNMGSNYDQGLSRNYASGYGNTGGYDESYGAMGYGEGLGMTGGYSNTNYGNRNRDWKNSYDDNNRNRDWWDRTKDEVSSWFGDDDAERRRRVDRINGPHKGKGPRDYHRSEDRIREDVCDRLADDDYVDASDIRIEIHNDEVILSGNVSSREEKRRAEDIVESVSGIRNVENRIRVGKSDANFDRYTGTTTDAGGVGRESGTTNEIIRNSGNEKNKNK
jgi:osmotically-inducible protein OsmY